MIMIGVGYRRELHEWIAARTVECLEITAEHFYGRDESLLDELSRRSCLFVHGLGLSLGTPGELDPERMNRFVRVVEIARPEWISEHIAFTRTAEVDLGHLNPVQPARAVARTIAAHAARLQSDAAVRSFSKTLPPTSESRESCRKRTFWSASKRIAACCSTLPTCSSTAAITALTRSNGLGKSHPPVSNSFISSAIRWRTAAILTAIPSPFKTTCSSSLAPWLITRMLVP